ncbi:MAG: Mn2+-dependent serine/threonine protein kinase [Clostridiales bacterium]|jgi:tRNA A-37 threonylcarbamoyl transferase component Bud32|nr:Mn2+-dependent serine/threonine protein kinase [Clostridiales bacterium]
MELTNLIATGEQAQVYKYNDLAVKVFNENTPKTAVLYEALTHSRIEETGLLVPKIMEVMKVDGKWAIAMECIEGKTLGELMFEDAENIDKYVNLMVDLQLEIHSKKAPHLSRLKDILISQIQGLDCIDESKKYELLSRLDGMPKHKKLCHGDFHPMNIILKDDKTYTVDWENAARGNASADTAKTFLLLALKDKKVAELYLNTFCKKSDTHKEYVQRWIPIMAAARLTENYAEEREMLMNWLDVLD